MIEINGIAHLILNVNRFELCVSFYEQLLHFMGLKTVHKNANYLYCVGGRTAIGIGRSAEKFKEESFQQQRIGLHHVCFRARSREEVDAVYQFLQKIEAKVIHPPEEGPWGPGYYSVLFEDPDGIRLEVNYVPGKGVLAEGVTFNPDEAYV